MKTLRSAFPLFIALVCAANVRAATGPSVAITSSASGFSTTLSNITVQGTSSGASALVSSVKVNFVAATLPLPGEYNYERHPTRQEDHIHFGILAPLSGTIVQTYLWR